LDPTAQLGYYHPGLGTMGAPNALSRIAQWWTRMLGLAFGYGLMANIADAYRFLMYHYEPGDRVFIFGFSRGAYTARALAAMLHMFGLFDTGNEALIAYASRLIKNPSDETFRIIGNFKTTFGRECKPHFVGVWDTVSSVGWIYDPVKLPYSANNPDIATGRHAISIDERRCFFRQNLWGSSVGNQDLRQVWFAGVHSDVGGSYPEPESGLSKITLQWMLREAEMAGLIVDSKKKQAILGADPNCAPPSPTAQIHNSLTAIWWVLEYWPKRYVDMECHPPETKWRIPRGKARHINAGATIHTSVFERIRQESSYRPANLLDPDTYKIEDLPQSRSQGLP
jgi:uncharacterized protein (DUF2235 family)